jgi:hypothetical protein
MGIQNRKAMGKNLRNVDMERAQLLNYCTTLVGLTLIILFVEMLKISQIFFSKNKIINGLNLQDWRNNLEIDKKR